MAKLYFKYGAMNCGKSIDICKTAHVYEKLKKKVVVFTSAIDDRFGKDVVTSRIGISWPARSISNTDNVYEIVSSYGAIPDIILVDEIQFFTKKHIEEFSDIVDCLNIPVICYGLRSCFKMQGFESSLYLLTIADNIEELKTMCSCGKKATVNARFLDGVIQTNGEQIMVGDLEYKSLCRKCYKTLVATKNNN